MGTVFDGLDQVYKGLFQDTVAGSAADPGAVPVAEVAKVAYNRGESADQKYQAAREAVVDHLAPSTSVSTSALGLMFDAAYSVQTAGGTPAGSQAASAAADAVRATVSSPMSGVLKLSGPSLLGTEARAWFGIVSAVIAAGAIAAIYGLGSSGKTSVSMFVALAIAIALSLLTLLLCVTGYSTVDIEGSRGDASANSKASPASGGSSN